MANPEVKRESFEGVTSKYLSTDYQVVNGEKIYASGMRIKELGGVPVVEKTPNFQSKLPDMDKVLNPREPRQN